MSPVTEQKESLGASRSFRYLLTSTAVSVTGDGILIAAAPLLAASLTRDPVQIGIVAAAGYAAWFLVGLPAGAFIDRWPRRPVLVLVDLARCAVLLTLALLIVFDVANIWMLVVAVFVLGIGACFFDPAAQAMIPAIVGRSREALTTANGKFWTVDTFGRSLAGPPLGAVLFGIFRSLPFVVDAISFLISAALVSRLPRVTPSNIERPRIRESIRDGVGFLYRTTELRVLAMGMALYNLGWNIAFATFVLFAQDVLRLGELGYGLLLAASALGGMASGWLMARAGDIPAVRVYAIALLAQAASWIGLIVVKHPWFAAVSLICVGIASTAVSVAGSAARQHLTPDDKLGRVFAATRLLGIGAAAVGALLGGLIADVAGLTAPYVISALLLVGASFSFFIRRQTS